MERWPIEAIHPYPRNARLHSDEQIDLIAASIQQYGFTAPLLVDEEGVLIYGHGRHKAAQKLGITDLPVCVAVGWSEEDKAAYRIADNQIALRSTWDVPLLKAELHELSLTDYDLPLLGFSEFDLSQFATDTPTPTQIEEDIIPPAPKVPITKPGDLWLLGHHRILCGDCRNADDVRRLIGSASINVAFTSPPYAEQRNYDEASGFKPIPPDEYVEWFRPVAENVAKHIANDGSWFVNIKPSAEELDTSLYVIDLVAAHVRQWGWHFATEFCWERGGVPKHVKRRFKNQFEPIYQFARGDWKMRPEAVRHPSENVPVPGGKGVGSTTWSSSQGGNGPFFGKQKRGQFNAWGGPSSEGQQGQPGASKIAARRAARKRGGGSPNDEKLQGTSWQSETGLLGYDPELIVQGLAYPGNRLPTFAGSHEATGHSAAFPVGLPSFFINAYSDQSDVIYDPFLGSGSTLIAAQRTSRIGYGMEISPAYVDIAVERWQQITGEKAQKKGPRG